MKKLFVLLLFALCVSSAFSQKIYRCTQLGIVNDSTKVQSKAFQSAIDRIWKEGGGVLVIPKGTFMTGTFRLRDNIELRLEEGARLVSSTNPYDIESRGLILAGSLKNVKITGTGTVDGRGLEVSLAIDSLHHIGEKIDPQYYTYRNRPQSRPRLFDLVQVEGLTIENINVRASAAWGIVLTQCKDVVIKNVDLLCRAYWNNDGIDLLDCKDVLIEGCNINSSDDGIVLKSYKSPTTGNGNENITIRDCDIISSANAVKLGTDSHVGFHHIRVSDIRVKDTACSAIAIECVDGGVVEDVVVDGVTAKNTASPFFVRLGHRRGDKPGTLSNIVIRNLTCDVPFGRPDEYYDVRCPDVNKIHNPFPSSITGIKTARVKNVTLENIDITYPGRATKAMGYIGDYRIHEVPENEAEYPEYHMFGELPAWGLYVRHVDGLTLKNVKMRTDKPDYRHPTVFDDVTKVKGKVNY